MGNEIKNDAALIQISSDLGSASRLSKFVINRDDARQIYDGLLHLANKISAQHNFALTEPPKKVPHKTLETAGR